MAHAAEDRALAHKIAGLIRSECELCGLPFGHLDVDAKLLEAQSMGYVFAGQHEDYRLALFQRELARREGESLGRHRNPLRRSGMGVTNKTQLRNQQRHEKRGKYKLQLHASILYRRMGRHQRVTPG